MSVGFFPYLLDFLHFLFFTALGCGYKGSNKIVGGEAAGAGEWPWQAFVTVGSRECGGTIISDKCVLTAAHCTQGYQ